VISDLMDPSDWAEPVRSLGRLGHQLIVARVACVEDDAPDFRGDLELSDAETGARVRITATPALLEAYRREVREHVERVRDACVRAGGRFVDARAELPTEALLRAVLAPGGTAARSA